MRPTLAISGSNLLGAGAFTTALRTGDDLLVGGPCGASRTDLAVLVRNICSEAGIALRDVGEVRIDRGPGSYVGLRVAVTFARFVASFTGAALRTADSLQLIAARALRDDPGAADRRLCPVIDGRNGRVHTAAFRASHGRLLAEAPARALERAALPAWLCAGDVVLAAPGLLSAGELPARATLHAAAAPTAADLLLAEVTLTDTVPEQLEPLYLMGSYVS